MMPIAAQAHLIAELRERLKEKYLLEDGDEALETTLEGATDLPEALARMARQIEENEALAEAVKGLARRQLNRASRFAGKADKLRNSLAWAMEEAGMKRIPADALPEMTVTMRAGMAELQIPNDDEVPDMYCKFERAPIRGKIRALLEEEGPQSWAYLGNARPVLTIKT